MPGAPQPASKLVVASTSRLGRDRRRPRWTRQQRKLTSTSFKTGSGLHIQAGERSTAPSLDSAAEEGNLNLEQGGAMVGWGSQACATSFSPLPDPSTTKEHQWLVPEPPTSSRGEDTVFLKRRGATRDHTDNLLGASQSATYS